MRAGLDNKPTRWYVVPMSRTPHNPEATRRILLESAARHMHRSGFQATSVDAILAETGVSKGALYHHFANKHELGLAVVEEVYRPPYLDAWASALNKSEDPLADLVAHLQHLASASTACTVQHGCPLNNLAQELAGVDEGFRLAIESAMIAWRDLVKDALNRAAAAQLLAPGIDSTQEALFTVAAIEGATGLAKTTRDARIFGDCMKALEGHLLGLRRRG